MTKWYDKPFLENYARRPLRWTGGPGQSAAFAGMLSFPLWYYLTKRKGFRGQRDSSLALSAITGAGAYMAAKPRRGLGMDTAQWADAMIPKLGTDIFTAPLDPGSVTKAIQAIPGLGDTQRAFLMDGVENATPSRHSAALTTLEGLADGYTGSVGKVTGGRLPYVTRAIEGAVIGSAFAGVMGLSPSSRRWAAGIAAVADSLYGNRLVGALGALD